MNWFVILLLSIPILSALPVQQGISKFFNRKGGRIIGGTDVESGEFPFIAAIYKETAVGRYFCGGSIISPLWILTSGFCVTGGIEFTIFVGTTKLNGNDQNRRELISSRPILNNNYNTENYEYDVGLILLRLPIELNNYIGPIKLALTDLASNEYVLATGWGDVNDESSDFSEILQKVTLVTIPNSQCAAIFGSGIVTDNKVCVTGSFNEGICTGDTGGPLIQIVNREPVHVGIASFMSGLDGCESPDPSGYWRTSVVAPWIHTITGINSS